MKPAHVFGQTLLGLLTIFGLAARADYWSDLRNLRAGLQISRLTDDELGVYSNPLIGPTQFRLNAATAPWAGNYYPMDRGGITQRWQRSSGEHAQPNQSFTPESLRALSSQERATLSPAEKLDLLLGHYNLPATQHELYNRGPQRFPLPDFWEGFCNGVRCAGINLPEPKYSVSLTNPDGIEIVFQPADLKALGGASYFYVEKYAQIGGPTREGLRQSPPNPAIFDLALRYFLARQQKAFVIDANLNEQIWNESVVGYRRNLSAQKNLTPDEMAKYPWARSKIDVTGQLDTLGEITIPASNGSTTERVADGSYVVPLDIAYTLYLDDKGQTQDGVWAPAVDNRGVDFAWFGAGRGSDSLYSNHGGNPELDFETIRNLYRQATIMSCKQILL